MNKLLYPKYIKTLLDSLNINIEDFETHYLENKDVLITTSDVARYNLMINDEESYNDKIKSKRLDKE